MDSPRDRAFRSILSAIAEGQPGVLEEMVDRLHGRVFTLLRFRLGPGLQWGDAQRHRVEQALESALRKGDHAEGILIDDVARAVEDDLTSAAHPARAPVRSPPIPASPIPSPPLEERRRGNTGGSLSRERLSEWMIALDRRARIHSKAEVERCCGELSRETRDVLLLRNFLGLPFPDIAKRLEMRSAAAAHAYHATAMSRLVERLNVKA